MNNTPEPTATATILEELRRYAEGLYYLSETDAPLEVVHFPATPAPAPTAAELATWAGKPQSEPVQTEQLSAFFQHLTTIRPDMGEAEKADAQRFQELQQYLEQHLQAVQVYRVGQRRITAFILGKTPAGDFAGLQTTLVET